jgi:dipeptidyl aminopeptidase/acylaminoacyl peptidase
MDDLASDVPTLHVKRRSIVVLVVLCGFAVTASGQGKHQVTLTDLLNLKEGGYTERLSPDGKMLVYSLDGDLWLMAAQPGTVPRKLAKGLLPEWSRDGTKLAFYSDESGSFQLWVIDIETNRLQQVTDVRDGIDPYIWTSGLGSVWEPLAFSWSPDGTKIVFASQAPTVLQSSSVSSATGANSNLPGDGTPLVLTGNTPPEWTYRGVFLNTFRQVSLVAFWEKHKSANAKQLPPETTNQLLEVDVRRHEVTRLTHDDFGYFNPEWSPDGLSIVCASNEGKRVTAGELSNIYIIDATTGNKRAVTSSSTSKWMPSWSPDGERIAYHGAEHELWGNRSIFVVSSRGGASTNVTAPLDRPISEYKWLPDSRSLVVSYHDGVSVPIAVVDISGKSARVLAPYPAITRALTISRSGKLVWQQTDGSTPGAIRVLDPGDHQSRALVDFNPEVSDWAVGEQEVVHWKNHRGDDLEGILIKPANYYAGHQYPLIVDCYPGQGNSFKGSPMWGNQAWASRGYLVFFPAVRAPHVWSNVRRSVSFMDAAKGPKGWDVTVDDVMSGVDELINRGIADPNRMGLYGFSAGGGILNYLVTRTNRFKCAVSVAPALSDWVRWALMNSDYSLVADFAGGVSLWDDPNTYIELSAVFHLNRVKTPMLLAAGDKDYDFLLDQIEMYNGLRQLGRDVTLLRYPDQGHGFTGTALEDFWDRENTFFDKFLGPVRSSDSSDHPPQIGIRMP